MAPTQTTDLEILEILKGFNLATRLEMDGFSGAVHMHLDYLLTKDFAKDHRYDHWFLFDLFKGFCAVIEGVLNDRA
ncbi:hypothetical protein [Helicobacter heilmannii]|uniref:hypothetical protein n=1 Tax=Helicobacter heilmannii TaxID=35817 RepID=UPI0006A00980|nr:hypothetical protein [Helicobacter heilmannii]CRF47928.1 hypothetical protein HHE02_12290 [Helicobacter heilmannii]